ncbi:MAG: hypothetical protein M3R24_13295 [Chloroflexota bacterium]|nr:hypothetical protein [Chloroflexota bacterium]
MDTAPERFGRHWVGVTAEARLEPLAPLIEYYTREMGELPGRLMIATNFLGDAQVMHGASQSAEIRQAVEQAQALVVSVMIRLLNAQTTCSCSNSGDLAADVQRLLDEREDRGQG